MLAFVIGQVGAHARRRASGGGTGPGPIGFTVLAVIVALSAFVVVAAIRAQRRRDRELVALLAERGFRQVAFGKKNTEGREQAFSLFAEIKWLKGGSKGLKWRADGVVQLAEGARAAVIAQHSYMVYTGHGGHAVTSTVVAMPCKGGWPVITLTRNNALARLFGAKSKVRFEDELFNRHWRFRGGEDGFALAVLSPRVQEVLNVEGASGEWWVIGGGANGEPGVIALGRTSTVNAKLLGEMLERVKAVVGALPPEVREAMGV